MDRGGDAGPAGAFDVWVEGDVEPAGGSATGVNVVAFDPVVDNVGADAQDGRDLCNGELVFSLGVGGVGLVDVR